MRFLVHEKSHETPIAAGMLRYERDGVPTGTVERWRITQALSDFYIVRVDLDARANDGGSFLYHLIMQTTGEFDRLTYRYLGKDSQAIAGNVLFSAESLINTHKINKVHSEEALPQRPFFFPSTIGLGLLLRPSHRIQSGTSVATLDMHSEGALEDLLRFKQLSPQLTAPEEEAVVIGRKTHQTQRTTITWQDQSRTIWLDEHNQPVKMVRGDGLTAVEVRYVRYG